MTLTIDLTSFGSIDPEESTTEIVSNGKLARLSNFCSSTVKEISFDFIKFTETDKLRLNNIIESGGWHFCNLKTPEKLLYKYKNLCETNDPVSFKEKIDEKFLNLDEIKRRIVKKKDIIGRDDNFNKIEIDESFPVYLQNNKNLYKDWIDE